MICSTVDGRTSGTVETESEQAEKDSTLNGKLDYAKPICRGNLDIWLCRKCRSWLRLRVGGR